jgi:oxalate decarboxylase
MPDQFWFDLANAAPTVDVKGGSIREANKGDFPVLSGMAVYLLELKPGAIRIPHWHPNASELDYVISGEAIIGLGEPDDETPIAQTFEVFSGQIAWIPQGWFHYIKNGSATEDLKMLVMFGNESPDDIGISRGFQAMPNDVLGLAFNVDPSTFATLDRGIGYIAPQ